MSEYDLEKPIQRRVRIVTDEKGRYLLYVDVETGKECGAKTVTLLPALASIADAVVYTRDEDGKVIDLGGRAATHTERWLLILDGKVGA